METLYRDGKEAWTHILCKCVLYKSTSWVECIMFVFRTSRDHRDRPSRSGQTGLILKRPSLPQPALGPRKKAVFFHSFIPSLTTSVATMVMMGLPADRPVCRKPVLTVLFITRLTTSQTRDVKMGRGHQGAAGLSYRGRWDGRYPNIHCSPLSPNPELYRLS
jgi:hypothetical protein